MDSRDGKDEGMLDMMEPDEHGLISHEFPTPQGIIRYWTAPHVAEAPTLVFLPGLTADYSLFEKQLEHFAGKANCLVWDPPSHGQSRPFDLSWSLDDVARWLHEILQKEGIERPVLVGQSMGGYISQVYIDMYPGEVAGFIAIDSSPLGRDYFQAWEIAFLKHTHAMYSSIPWKLLRKWGSTGCSTTEYGRALMLAMMDGYAKREYVDLAAHGYKVVAEAIEAQRPYRIDCPAIILCGTKDMAGSSRRYSKNWAERTGLPMHWIEGAGHNSNADDPAAVNAIIENFLEEQTVS